MTSKLKLALDQIIKAGYKIDRDGKVTNGSGKEVVGSKTDGYLKFSVRTDFNSSFPIRHHKFAAYVKFGDKMFEKGMVVRHMNGNREDNSRKNIKLGTQSENMFDRPVKERKEHKKNKTGIPDEIKEQILKDKDTLSSRKLSDKYDLPRSTIVDFLNRNKDVCMSMTIMLITELSYIVSVFR